MTIFSFVPDKYLPTSISRLVAILFATIACTAVSIPKILQKMGIILTIKEEMLLQASWFFLFIFLGTFIVYILAVNKHCKRSGFFTNKNP